MIANMSSLVSNMNQRKSYMQKKEMQYTDFAVQANLPNELYERIIEAFRFNMKKNTLSFIEQSQFLQALPTRLQSEVYDFLFQGIIKKCQFFKGKTADFIHLMANNLKPVMGNSGSILYSYGQVPVDIFFLQKGVVNLKDKNDVNFKTYIGGSYFGEIEIIFGKKRKATAYLQEDCQLFKVYGQTMIQIIGQFPEYKKEFIENAQKKLESEKEARNQLRKAHDQMQIIKQRDLKTWNQIKSQKARLSTIQLNYNKLKQQRNSIRRISSEQQIIRSYVKQMRQLTLKKMQTMLDGVEDQEKETYSTRPSNNQLQQVNHQEAGSQNQSFFSQSPTIEINRTNLRSKSKESFQSNQNHHDQSSSKEQEPYEDIKSQEGESFQTSYESSIDSSPIKSQTSSIEIQQAKINQTDYSKEREKHQST